MIRRELLAIDGLAETSPAFQRKLVEVSDRLGLTASYLAAVIRFESGFDPKRRNFACVKAAKAKGKSTDKCAVGLIQFTAISTETLGTTMGAISRMSALEQLDWVEKHYAFAINWKGQIDSLEDHYLAVFAPQYIGAGPDEALPYTGNEYQRNSGLDHNGDGVITAGEATRPVRSLVDAAQGKPPILVDMDAPLTDGDADVGLLGAALLVSLMAWAFGRYKYRARSA